jgi:N-acyl-D-amino-acid deacylase
MSSLSSNTGGLPTRACREGVVEYDLVVRNGTVIDGTGMPGFQADVAVAGSRVRAVGRIKDRARREIDAEGHVVTPGFVDGHTHMDAQVMWDPLGSSSCWHGVTSVVMGNCGFSLAPASEAQRDLVVRNLERAEEIPGTAMSAGIADWCWETFRQYLDEVDRRPKAINYAAYVGHSALRTWSMGERAFDEEAKDDDIVKMERQLEDGIRAGAMGFTTSRSENHQTSDGRPVASRLASWDEVRRLVDVLGRLGTGVFELAQARAVDVPGQEGDRFLTEVRDIAVSTGVPTTFGIHTFAADGSDWQRLLEFIDTTANLGGRIFGQTHCRGVSSLFSFKTRLPFDVLPDWQEIRRRPLPDQRHSLSDPVVRSQLVSAAHAGPYGRTGAPGDRQPDYHRILILDHPLPPHRSVAEVASERGVDPVDLMIDLAMENDFDQLFLRPAGTHDPEHLLQVISHPRSVMTFSDSGAHVQTIMDSSIQTHLLAYWVRQKQALSLEAAIRMLTLVPATCWGFWDRGLLRPGMAADINVFDPTIVAPTMPEVMFDLPGGAKRLVQRAVGFLATIVGGEVAFRDGEDTGALPGKLLRGPGAASRLA